MMIVPPNAAARDRLCLEKADGVRMAKHSVKLQSYLTQDEHEARLGDWGYVGDWGQLRIETAKEFGDPVPEPKGQRLMLA